MSKKRILHTTLGLLAAALLFSMLTLPAAAAEQDVQEVASRLQTLQRVQIDPNWLPDIKANQTAVQAMLDAFLACSAEEKKSFTAEQNKALNDYFKALYTVLDKDPSEIDILFSDNPAGTGSAATSSKPASSQGASSSTSSSSLSSNLAGQSNAESLSASSSGSAPAESDASALSSSSQSESSSAASSTALPPAPLTISSSAAGSLPRSTFPPQTPAGGGWQTLLGSKTFGNLLLATLGGLSLLLFLRFLAAVKKAGSPAKSELAEDQQKRELFGELYEDQAELSPHEETHFSAALKAARDSLTSKPEAVHPKPKKRKNPPPKAASAEAPFLEEAPDSEAGSFSAFPPPAAAAASDPLPDAATETEEPPEITPAPLPFAPAPKSKSMPQQRTGRPNHMPFTPEDLDE